MYYYKNLYHDTFQNKFVYWFHKVIYVVRLCNFVPFYCQYPNGIYFIIQHLPKMLVFTKIMIGKIGTGVRWNLSVAYPSVLMNVVIFCKQFILQYKRFSILDFLVGFSLCVSQFRLSNNRYYILFGITCRQRSRLFLNHR